MFVDKPDWISKFVPTNDGAFWAPEFIDHERILYSVASNFDDGGPSCAALAIAKKERGKIIWEDSGMPLTCTTGKPTKTKNGEIEVGIATDQRVPGIYPIVFNDETIGNIEITDDKTIRAPSIPVNNVEIYYGTSFDGLPFAEPSNVPDNVELFLLSDIRDGIRFFKDRSVNEHYITNSVNTVSHSANTYTVFNTTSIYFNGSSDYLRIKNAFDWHDDIHKDFTIECWWKWENTTNDGDFWGFNAASDGANTFV